MKLRLLMSHCKNSMRYTAVGKRRIYSDSERGTLKECGPSQRGVQGPWNVLWLVFDSWVISYANEREYHSDNWGTTHSSVFWQWLGTVLAHLNVSFSLQVENQGLVEFVLSSCTHLILIGLCYALVLCHSFKVVPCPLPSCSVLFSWALSCLTVLPLQSSGGTTRKQLDGNTVKYPIPLEIQAFIFHVSHNMCSNSTSQWTH